MTSLKGVSFLRRLNEQSYILRVYVKLTLFALSRVRPIRKDMLALAFMVKAPLLYVLGVRGELHTPSGTLLITDRRTLRSFTYGFIKTHFAYCRTLTGLLPNTRFFPVVMDVGANIGDFTLAMTESSGRVVSVEPEPQNFLALTANIRINSVHNVCAIEAAAHSTIEQVHLEGARSDMYVSSRSNGTPVKALTIDELTKDLQIERISLLKIDVQGHENAVLVGSSELLRAHLVDLLIVELHLRRGIQERVVIDFMKEFGYTLSYRDPYFVGQPHLYFVPTAKKQIDPTLQAPLPIPIIGRRSNF